MVPAIRRAILILLLLAVPFMQGCAVTAASALGYWEASSKYTKLYNNYKAEQESSGWPVTEYKEWLKEQPLSRRELKIFKMYGTISEKEAKEIRVEEEELEDLEKLE
ncbi:MAG: hypothetical protein ISS89_04275 [Candidatus Omnitrophica bacterium]|nr:hypothetical protein [Candidatus Omnitrophota bacterium]